MEKISLAAFLLFPLISLRSKPRAFSNFYRPPLRSCLITIRSRGPPGSRSGI